MFSMFNQSVTQKNIFLYFLSVDIFVQINYSLNFKKREVLFNDWFGLS